MGFLDKLSGKPQSQQSYPQQNQQSSYGGGGYGGGGYPQQNQGYPSSPNPSQSQSYDGKTGDDRPLPPGWVKQWNSESVQL